MVNLLITYKLKPKHHDPDLEEFTYGDSKTGAKELKNKLKKGDYVFFHTSIRGKRYITTYYIVDRVLDTKEACEIKEIVNKYKNPHIIDYLNGIQREEEDAVLFGDPILSKILVRPLPFNRTLAEKLSLNILFNDNRTENECISSATRAKRNLTEEDVSVILEEIKKWEEKGIDTDIILSTDEVLEINEKDLENYLVHNTDLMGENLMLIERQMQLESGRLDLLYEDENRNYIVVELKLNEIGRSVINQIRGYIGDLRKQREKEVRGIIVCKDILPIFVEEFENVKDIDIFHYGWRLTITKRYKKDS